MHALATDFGEVLTSVEHEKGVIHPVNITNRGKMHIGMPDYLYNYLTTKNSVYWSHQFAVLPETYEKY